MDSDIMKLLYIYRKIRQAFVEEEAELSGIIAFRCYTYCKNVKMSSSRTIFLRYITIQRNVCHLAA